MQEKEGMAYSKLFFLFVFLVFATSSITTQGVRYTITNNATDTIGGARYTNEVGVLYSLEELYLSTNFIWRIFHQFTEADRKNTTQVNLIIEPTDGIAYTIDNSIYFNTGYIETYNGSIKAEFTGIVYHEMTHVWQWSGNDTTPGGLIEGIADFVRLKAGYAPSHWVQPGEGDSWDYGYDVTARFLDYCNDLKNGFVAELNNKMRNGYGDFFFVDILGKTVEELWTDYKAKYY